MKYVITEVEGFSTNRVFNCRSTSEPDYKRRDVWVDKDSGLIACTSCSGPLKAMVSTCPHASAVKRFIRKQNGPK